MFEDHTNGLSKHAVALFNTPEGVLEMCDSEPFDRKVPLSKCNDQDRLFQPVVLIYKGHIRTYWQDILMPKSAFLLIKIKKLQVQKVRFDWSQLAQ